MLAVFDEDLEHSVLPFHRVDLGSRVGRKAVECFADAKEAQKSGEGGRSPRDLGNGEHKGDVFALEMIGLHPYPRFREGTPPVFFDIAIAVDEVDKSAIDVEFADDLMVYIDDPVIAFHKGHEGKRSHDPRLSQGGRIGADVFEMEVALDADILVLHIETDPIFCKETLSDKHFKTASTALKIVQRIAQILGLSVDRIKKLDEGMVIPSFLAERNTGDEGDHMLHVFVDQFEIPSFKIVFALIASLKYLGAKYLPHILFLS